MLAESCSSVFASRRLPRRVSVTVPTTTLLLCDYCFPDESEEVNIPLQVLVSGSSTITEVNNNNHCGKQQPPLNNDYMYSTSEWE